MRIVQVLCQLYAVREDSAAAFQHTRPVVANKIRHWIAQRTVFYHRYLGVLCLFQLESVLEKVQTLFVSIKIWFLIIKYRNSIKRVKI